MKPAPIVLFCLHYLGGSGREFAEVALNCDASHTLVTIDLPGFGSAAGEGPMSVQAMADYVINTIRGHQPERWMLVGHSMGAKIAAVLARRAEDGTLGVSGLLGLVLLAGSPPGPEPMEEEKRATMTSWFTGDLQSSGQQAHQYVSDNIGAALHVQLQAVAVEDVLSANRGAWVGWLQSGSKEDWSDRVGTIRLPTLIITGSADQGLGLEAQRRYMAPHFENLKIVDLEGAGHLLPLERPHEVARLIDHHVGCATRTEATNRAGYGYYDALIQSDRVGRGTREALTARGERDAATYVPQAMSHDALAVLRSVIDRVIPQDARPIDLAARLDRQLASGHGDGWRSALLPSDPAAYCAALDTLNQAAHDRFDAAFTALLAAHQDELLQRIVDGSLAQTSGALPPGHLHAQQMQAWFADLRADATRHYMAHPDTLARIGYSGIANGGDGLSKSGFVRLGVGQREAWEPVAIMNAPS